MNFERVTKENIAILREYYKICGYKISDYSAGIKLMWKNADAEFAIAAGCLIVREKTGGGQYAFNYPVSLEGRANGCGCEGGDLSIPLALKECAAFCAENFTPFRLCAVPRGMICEIASLFPEIEVSARRNTDDYLYLAADFIGFSGKKYAGQRNHVRKFHSLYPTAVFEKFSALDKPRIRRFFKRLEKGVSAESKGAKTELKYARAMAEEIGENGSFAGGYTLNGELLSFSLGEICGETLVNHIEKGLPEYEGVYPATVQAFATAFAGGVKYINREDDAGSRGLRISKLQYQPLEILAKYDVKIKTPLNRLKKVPTVRGENGVCLTPISERDIPEYNRLCLDDERNRWWGYDYRKDCEHPARDWFYKDQKKDFASRTAMNFAIRKDERFAGEVILYNFDFCGGAEIGVRILPEFDGQGIGRYAFNLAAGYAIYKLELSKIKGKCLKENIASEKMLSSVMKKSGEDGQYYYYTKIV
ncbi:MAG: GNAT family N-acetyltransferase [Clostridia bacterium]|nr:GNAT family N-acetyltransferase [Clostridia bacterium]